MSLARSPSGGFYNPKSDINVDKINVAEVLHRQMVQSPEQE